MEQHTPQSSHAPSQPSAQPPKKSRAGLGWAIILGLVLIIIVLALLDKVFGVNIFTNETERQEQQVMEFLEETGEWHAVFLTNGQVYFGQLADPDAQYATLSDVYYLQVQQGETQPIAAPQIDPNNPEAQAQVVEAPQPSPPRLTLIKFGTELHGPQDFMRINRDHILFWEALKSDSQVVQAIVNYKQGL